MKKHFSRSGIFRIYKMMCKKLEVDCICFGKMHKKDAEACIYAETFYGSRYPVLWWKGMENHHTLSIGKNAKKDDVQKAIVLRVMKALETGDVLLFDDSLNSDYPTIPKGICWEEELIKMDLEGC